MLGAVTRPAHPTDPLPRRIAHLDMDAFFASVELLRYPQLKGLPVVIGGGRRREDDVLARLREAYPERDWSDGDLSRIPLDFFPRLASYTGRGVITTATYAARQFGVGSAMGLMKAAKLCPQAILLPVDFDEVRRISRLFKSTILEIAPVMEDRGVDEVYIDFTHVPGGQREGGRVLARLIQKSIFQATGITCSIGVAPNKLIAKMASEFNKPNGISIVWPEDLQDKIWPLPCRKVNGVGPKADEKLQGHGIHTIGDLAAREPGWLIEHFGKSYGRWLHAVSWGRDDRPVVTESEPVSMSRETTFDRDLHAVRDRAELGAVFTRLCEQVADDLQRKGYAGKTIGIKLRYDNFQSVTRDVTIDHFTADAATIRRQAGLCLKRVDLSRRIRLLGVRVGKLVKPGTEDGPHAGYSENTIAKPRTAKDKATDEHTDLLFPELD
ncbi:DNA polymerase IV [Hydrogenophaga taeniospiralis]|uniref:Y-family DNA polymerase n=1 Tax=Hydrogenophaga taeniospiralis TaxID=65656 RepID=UPI0039B057F7|nr:DNA polymerase IV [Hydrogenophaga taeniospiralis]